MATAGEALPPSNALTGPGDARALGLRAHGCRVHRTADRLWKGDAPCNGDGTLQKPARVANVAGDMAVADLNGDSKLDFVVANSPGNSVSLYLGNGNGTFQAARSFALGVSPGDVVVADFNRDGKLDLVTTNAMRDEVSVLLGNGDGTFRAAGNFAAGTSVQSVAAGDFDSDGFADLVTANYMPDTGLSVLLNDQIW